MAAKYRAEHIGSLLRPAELLQARSGGRTFSNCARWRTSIYYRCCNAKKISASRYSPTASYAAHNFMSDFNEAVEGLDESDNLAPHMAGQRRLFDPASRAFRGSSWVR